VKAVHDTAALNLDLNRTENEQFPPEKMRMTLERFYISVVVGVTELFRHVTRLRSWKEPARTTLFCAVCIRIYQKRFNLDVNMLILCRDILLLGLWTS
jgi:hypothetical protein